MDHYAVFGQPVDHSLSPRIHTSFAAQTEQQMDYRAIETGAGELAQALEIFRSRGGHGANITLPLKSEVVALCHTLSERAQRAEAVNTLRWEPAGWHGDNTDGLGLCRDLTQRIGFKLREARVLLLGAGGAARGIIEPLLQSGVQSITVANRSADRLEELLTKFPGVQGASLDELELRAARPWALTLNALSSGHQGEFPLPTCPGLLKGALAYDLSYGKAAQPFLSWADASGAAQRCDGLGMLVEQAAESFFIWRGLRPETHRVLATLREDSRIIQPAAG